MRLSQVYRYGLLDPVSGVEFINDQLWLAHRYRNKLVEIEKAFRLAYEAAYDSSEQRAIDAELAATEDEAKRQELFNKRHAVRTEIKKTPAFAVALEAAKKVKMGAIREARRACAVYWGTYLLAEQAAEAASGEIEEPKFKRWDGEGALGVQMQKGMPIDKLTGCQDRRAQLILAELPVPGRKGKPRPRIKLRIGTVDNQPKWAEWPIIYHRPLPSGCVIKWIKAVRSKIATRTTWSLHVVIDRELEEVDQAANVVVLDLRWRRDEAPTGEATRRAGEWTNGKEAATILLNPSVVGELRKTDDLKSIRDKRKNEMHARLLDWVKGRDLPEEHREQTAHIAQWKSPLRFAKLAIWWSTHRTPGDADIFHMLETWRKHDKHLWLWEAHARRRAIYRRREQYRLVAFDLAARHDGLVVESLPLDQLAVKKSDDDSGKHKARAQRVDTAPSELRAACLNAFKVKGKAIFKLNPPGPLSSLWQAWREQKGVERVKPAARSKRFNRLRKINEGSAKEGQPSE